LCLNDVSHMFRVESLPTKLINGDRVIHLTRVDLFHSWLVLETLPVAFDVLRSARGIFVFIEIGLYAVMCGLLRT